jgi:hypothetical protein
MVIDGNGGVFGIDWLFVVKDCEARRSFKEIWN